MCVLFLILIICTTLVLGRHPQLFRSQPYDLKGCYDFIVVGAGSAGCRVAEKLSQNQDYSVLILEAGKVPADYMDIPLMTPLAHVGDAVWRYQVVPNDNAFKSQPNKPQSLVGGRVLGGSSTINLMNYERGDKKDYDRWEKEYGAKGWNGEEVFKYFKADEGNEDFNLSDASHGRDGELLVSSSYDTDILHAFFKASMDKGYPVRDTGDGDTNGVYRMQATIGPNGHRSSAFTAFLEPHIGKRKNIQLSLNSLVTKLIFSFTHDNETIARAVEFQNGGKLQRICAKKEIILSAGAIQTPQLLMLSGIGPEEHLRELKIPVIADLPVGENLQNHVLARGVSAEMEKASLYQVPSTKDMNALVEWYRFGSGPFSSPVGTHLGVGFFKMNESDTTPDIEIMLQGLRHDETCPQNQLETKKTEISFLPILMRPKSRGNVLLASKDPRTPPLIDLNYFEEADDIEILAKGAKFAHELIASEAFAALGITQSHKKVEECKDHDIGDLEYWKCMVTYNTASMGHPCGTCRMGSKDSDDTVVDERLRVKGIMNLRVADASVFPTLNTGHTNAPAIMVGAKAGDLILEDHQFGFMQSS